MTASIDPLSVPPSAKTRLSNYIVWKAEQTAHKVGFGWRAVPDAPDRFRLLQDAYAISRETRQDLPVSSLYCETVVFTDPSINHAMRFWHDCSHIANGLTFKAPDELELGLWHMQEMVKDGFDKHSLEVKLLEIDTVGQNYCLAVGGRFPNNQRQFTEWCLRYGVHEGVLREIRQG